MTGNIMGAKYDSKQYVSCGSTNSVWTSYIHRFATLSMIFISYLINKFWHQLNNTIIDLLNMIAVGKESSHLCLRALLFLALDPIRTEKEHIKCTSCIAYSHRKFIIDTNFSYFYRFAIARTFYVLLEVISKLLLIANEWECNCI